MSVDLGALRPTETVPLTFLAPPHASSTLQHRVQRTGPLNPSGGITGQGVPPEPPWARPPKPGGLGWNWSLGKTAHFAGTEALPSVIPHKGTKLGTLAQRWGMGAGWSNKSRTHAPAARLKAKAISADPLVAANTRTVSLRRVR